MFASCRRQNHHRQDCGRHPQGLGEAISLALPHVNNDEPLLIVLSDTLFDADLGVLYMVNREQIKPKTELFFSFWLQNKLANPTKTLFKAANPWNH